MQVGLAVRDGQQVPAVRVGNRSRPRPSGSPWQSDESTTRSFSSRAGRSWRMAVSSALGGHRGLADRQGRCPAGPRRCAYRRRPREPPLPERRTDLNVDGAALRRLLVPRDSSFPSGFWRGPTDSSPPPRRPPPAASPGAAAPLQQVRAPNVPSSTSPHGSGRLGMRSPRRPTPAQPGRMVPRKVGRVLRAVGVSRPQPARGWRSRLARGYTRPRRSR